MTEPTDLTSSAATRTPTWERTTLEKLAMANVAEQRARRRWKIFFRFIWLGLIAAALWFWFIQSKQKISINPEHTALVEVQGVIAPDMPASAYSVIEGLQQAFEAPNAKAVVLLINSPGGSPVQAGMINDEIYRLKAIHKKPVYAVVEDICASGGYYIAAAADEIFVDKASLVGSIGVIMQNFGAVGLMEKLGVENRTVTAGNNKALLDPLSPEKPEQRAFIQTQLDQIHQQFIEVVKKGRGARLKETPDTFSGLIWNGQQAVEMGLADKLGSVDSVARDVVKAEEIINYTPQQDVWQRLSQQISASFGKALQTTAHPQLQWR